MRFRTPLATDHTGAVDLQAELVAACAPEVLFDWVSDLVRYPEWLEIVTQAQPGADGSWAVDLRGRMGPLARTKRLRMVRPECVAPTHVVFERAELDGRDHSPFFASLPRETCPFPSHVRCGIPLKWGSGVSYDGKLFA